MEAIYEIDGYGIVLAQVQNYYPVEYDEKIRAYSWGFKYISGVFEYFHYSKKLMAESQREKFIDVLNSYYKESNS